MYPALAVLQTLPSNADVLWVGGEGGMEARLVQRANVPFKTVPAAGLHGVDLKALPGNLYRLVRGFFASRRILKNFKPDVLFFTGGYVAVPMALAGRRTPIILYVPDIEPALALKTLANFADRIALTAESSIKYFKHPERLVVTGYPLRSDLARWTRTDARRSLALDDGSPVLLVFGGSKGAHSINTAVLANLHTLLQKVQVVHISGGSDWQSVQAIAGQLDTGEASRYHPFQYLEEQMGAALASADLVLSRAGASTLGEFPFFGLPAVLVPYPYAWRYQKVNADYLVQHGAAVMIEDERLSDLLVSTVNNLLADHQKLGSMRAAMQAQSRPQAAAEIGRLVLALAGERS